LLKLGIRKPTVTPKKDILKFDPAMICNYLYFTAEPRRTQSLFTFLFSFERKENKNHKPYGNITILFEYILVIALLWFFRNTKT